MQIAVDPLRLTYQADDARRSLLVANEKKTLSGVRGPGNVMVGSLGGLLSLEVVGERLGLNGVAAEVEELLAGNEVPVGRRRLAHDSMGDEPLESLLGEAQASSLVAQVTLLNGLDLLLLLLSLGSLLGGLSGLGLLDGLVLGHGNILDGGNVGGLGVDDGRRVDNGKGLRSGLLGDVNLLLCVGQSE